MRRKGSLMSSQAPATPSTPSPPTLAMFTFQHPHLILPRTPSNIVESVHGILYSSCLLNEGVRRRPCLTQMKDQLQSSFWCRRRLQAHLRPRNADSCLLCVGPSTTVMGGEKGFKLPGPEARSHAYSSWRSESEKGLKRNGLF